MKRQVRGEEQRTKPGMLTDVRQLVRSKRAVQSLRGQHHVPKRDRPPAASPERPQEPSTSPVEHDHALVEAWALERQQAEQKPQYRVRKGPDVAERPEQPTDHDP